MRSPAVAVVIPARFASERYPGKPLAEVAGEPLVLHALRTAAAATSASLVLVATDDERVASVVREAGHQVVMTDPALPSGSDRVWAAAAQLDVAIVVNLQVDEPLLPGRVVDLLVERLELDPATDIATPAVAVRRSQAASDDVVTVACEDGMAQYFSRSLIPWRADPVFRHIGVYAYRREALARFVAAPPGKLERTEGLEQLRALAIGLSVGVVSVDAVCCAVDRPEDVAAVERLMANPGLADIDALAGIRLVVLDVDGVLTDGRISYFGDQDQMMSFDVKDGHGLVALRRAGVEVALVSSRDSPALRRRAAELGIDKVYVSVTDKAGVLKQLVDRLGLALGDVCFVGDDVVDVEAMSLCGLSAAPSDGADAAKAIATFVLGRPGGRGAVRELADRILHSIRLSG